jgi:hypothetical protein
MVDGTALSFLDGYLYRVMVEMLRSTGVQESGLYDFYKARIEQERCALSGYDRLLVDYISRKFDPQSRRVLHAGIGVGTLASALALAGFQVAGLERDRGRFAAASQLRHAVAQSWPVVADRYELIAGTFPTTVADSGWVDPRTILVFTNCGSGWSEAFTIEIINLFPRFGDVILDARLFGRVRDLETEREVLIASMRARGLWAMPLVETNRLGAYYFHLHRPQGAP